MGIFNRKKPKEKLNEGLKKAEEGKQSLKEDPWDFKTKEKLMSIINVLADPEEPPENKPFTLYEEDGKETTKKQLWEKEREELFEIADQLFEQAYKQRIMW